MNVQRKKIFFWIKLIIIVYCSIGIALYYLQERFLFHPTPLPTEHAFNFTSAFEEINIPVNKTDTINVVRFSAGAAPKGAIVYYHGNRENVEYYAKSALFFTSKGYEVWMPDYPGYGKSRGVRSEKKLYEVANLVQPLVRSRFPADQVIVYGRSLGTGIAAYAATIGPCRALVLETPYYSMSNLFAHYAWMYPASMMSNYKIPTWKLLEDVSVPVTIFHGTADRVIPYSSAARLIPLLKSADRFFTIPDGKHNNLAGSGIYQQVMDSILR